MNRVGLHIRITSTLSDAARRAIRLGIAHFQCFLVNKNSNKLLAPSREDAEEFRALCNNHLMQRYMHGSYWINLAAPASTYHYALYREVELAQKLAFTHIVLHPGSAKYAVTKQEGIEWLVLALNDLVRKTDLQIVLENTAHGNKSIGGDLQDFKQILALVENPEKIFFCIDTAHAYSYGYDIVSAAGRQDFMQELELTIGVEKIQLLHVNDTSESLGSKIDRHQLLGKGLLGFDTLRAFVTDSRLKHIPIIMELPEVAEEEERALVELVRSWDQ